MWRVEPSDRCLSWRRVEGDNVVGRVAELEAMVVALAGTVEKLRVELAVKDRVIIDQANRIGERERALEDSGWGGKRQAAPFAKGSRPRARRRRAVSRGPTTAATGTGRHLWAAGP
jgi:hypothetical protein